jgi:FkbH-like protein
MSSAALLNQAQDRKQKSVKCVVWDLDETLWNGVLLEDREVKLRENVVEIVKELDRRGILQSVASKNNEDKAREVLRGFGLEEYFLYPQINWNSKTDSVRNIAGLLNIGLDTVALIDDQPFEREEVNFSLPEVLCLDAACLDRLLEMRELKPSFVTEDSRLRRQMYLADHERNRVEREFVGPQEDFLATLGMVFTIGEAREDELLRAQELTNRTNQLNTTGYSYSYEQLNRFRESTQHKLFITSLSDKYGSYGKIGLALVECEPEAWVIKLLLMSCRVMSRGVGTILLNHIMRLASEAGVRLLAEFVANDRNRMMYVTFKLAGFKERSGSGSLLENGLARIPPLPGYVDVRVSP